MKSVKQGYHFLAAIVLAAVSPWANSAPAVCDDAPYTGEFDGRFYQVVVASGISWDAARTAAGAAVNDGVLGQLATINSFAEDEYVHCLIQATAGAAGREAWIGGFQAPDSSEPEVGWQWLNGEVIEPVNTPGPNYTNWQEGEPNNDTGEDNERHLGASLGGNFGWNDEGRLGNIGSYVVEFGDALAPIPAAGCASVGPGCPLGSPDQVGQLVTVIQYPPQAIIGEGDVEVRTWRFTDDPDRCGISEWNLGELVEGDGPLIIPPYLCSTPTPTSNSTEIIVRRTESSVQVPTGIIQITGTNKYGTANPVHPNDPGFQDVVVYRNNIDSEQLETADEMGVDPLFLGNVAETTNGVINPPRGAGNKGTYVIEYLRIHFGAAYDFSANPDGNHAQMIALQRYKLTKARAAVNATKPALKPVSWLAMKVLADAALYFHDRGNYEIALHKVKLLLKLNDQLKYKVIAGKNPYGEVAYRYLNARDIYERRLIPYN